VALDTPDAVENFEAVPVGANPGNTYCEFAAIISL
jgi:hypothetical protein